MKVTPLISVVMPTYNSSEFIEATLQSIKKQTYKNVEIIVVDNNSKDNTKDIAKHYTNKVFNQGPERSAQVNFGVQKARGEYVYKVDDDFILDPEVIEQCVSKAQQGFSAVVVHNTPDASINWLAKVRKFEIDMYKYNLDNSAARFVSKIAYKAIGGINERLIVAEDYDFQNRLTKAGYATGFIDAEAIHLGEPKNFRECMKKFYLYGKDLVNYSEHNSDKSSQQLGVIRAGYVKNWRNFVKHPTMTVLFVYYMFFKYSFGAIGFGVGKINKLTGRTVVVRPIE